MVTCRGIAMRRDEIFAIAQGDLAHIPKGDYHQGVLRSTYWMMRLNSLGKRREFPDDPRQLIELAVADVHRLEPSVSLDYDQDYFGGQQ
jgi:hypothetical protein